MVTGEVTDKLPAAGCCRGGVSVKRRTGLSQQTAREVTGYGDSRSPLTSPLAYCSFITLLLLLWAGLVDTPHSPRFGSTLHALIPFNLKYPNLYPLSLLACVCVNRYVMTKEPSVVFSSKIVCFYHYHKFDQNHPALFLHLIFRK